MHYKITLFSTKLKRRSTIVSLSFTIFLFILLAGSCRQDNVNGNGKDYWIEIKQTVAK